MNTKKAHKATVDSLNHTIEVERIRLCREIEKMKVGPAKIKHRLQCQCCQCGFVKNETLDDVLKLLT